MPAGNGKTAEKSKWLSLDVTSAIKTSIVVNAAFLFLPIALIIAITVQFLQSLKRQISRC
jgi:hypothetical protein